MNRPLPCDTHFLSKNERMMTSAQVVETSGQCHHKQSFSGLHSTRKIKIADLLYDSWVQTRDFLGPL